MTLTVQPLDTSALSDVAFLRERCATLQRALTVGTSGVDLDAEVWEGVALSRWTVLLVPLEPWPPRTQLLLEELYVLQARIVERLLRGGVADISKQVECLVRAMLVDELQRRTDAAVAAIS